MIAPVLWVLVQYPKGEYAIFSGTGDTWRRSSPIQNVGELDRGWLVNTETSQYTLYEDTIGMSGYMESIWNYAVNKARGMEELPKLLIDRMDIHRAMHNLIKYRSM